MSIVAFRLKVDQSVVIFITTRNRLKDHMRYMSLLVRAIRRYTLNWKKQYRFVQIVTERYINVIDGEDSVSIVDKAVTGQPQDGGSSPPFSTKPH